MIKVAKKCNVDTSFTQEALDVIEGLTEHSLKQNTRMMKMCSENAEQLKIPSDHVRDFATFLKTQKIRVVVLVRDKSEGETPGDDRRSRRSRRKKKKNNSSDKELEYTMFKFNTLRDLKLEAFQRDQIPYYTLQWWIKGEEITDEQETFESLGVEDGHELELIVQDRHQRRWVTRSVYDEVCNIEESLLEDMQDSKDRLVSAIKDKDFHNFLRFSSQLRRQWCKRTTTKGYKETFAEKIKDAQRKEHHQKSSRRYYERSSSSYSTPGGSSSRRNRYDRDSSYRDHYYEPSYGVTVGGVHCHPDDTPGYERRSSRKDWRRDEY